ncbi:ShlB/FhaC/HecB family hemolysin secretion/activation protein [Helicobacter muridarum]|uniref:Hemolysin transporter protein shlB n=1 Tax=Helicobacter muridarum TaxID=216 RepID=A0A099TZ31_9HELI|nr:ShlB/FhaC/HecB family hemolysin secretion/activation protein [Helicobacter muridarum]TLE00949.1 ShlB/FhaC/HecB family hemolysin secretion/activation protein [Helicobacter muridarum]STQ86733.1 Hemolysin transporter protein shlB precursor [Helicobacter muridarum]
MSNRTDKKRFVSSRNTNKILLSICIPTFFINAFLAPSIASQGKETLCFPIHKIYFSSISSYLYPTTKLQSDETIDDDNGFITKQFPFTKTIIKPYLNQCLNGQDIVSLLQNLNETAIKNGYITTHFGIGEQDLSLGELEVRTQIGKIGDIDYQSNGNMLFFKKDFAIKHGDILNLKKLEQGVSNLTKIKHIDTNMKILPTYSDDMSDVLITLKKKGIPLSGKFIFDNSSTLFDHYQSTLLLNYENPLKLADTLTLYLLGSIPFKNKPISKNYNLYSSISYAVPIRRFLLETNLAYSKNALQIPLSNFTLDYHSWSFNIDTKLSYALLANQKHNISIGFSLGSRISNSFIEDVELVVQRQRILQYSLFSQYALTLSPYRFSINLSILHGFSMPTPVSSSFNYIVPTLNLYAYVPFKISKFTTIYTASIRTQVAQNRLYANEQILIGGLYAVRGFQGINLSGQFGVIWRNDISVYIPMFSKSKWELTIAPSIGIDAGYIKNLLKNQITNLPDSGVFLSGAGIGLQCILKHFNIQTWWHFPIYSANRFKTQSFFFAMSTNW